MGARKQYHTDYDGRPYTEHELKEQADYIAKFPGIEDANFTGDSSLCDKWRPDFLGDTVRFRLVDYEFCGATYGIELYIKGCHEYKLRTYEDSGYSKGTVIRSSSDITGIRQFIQGFEPARYIHD